MTAAIEYKRLNPSKQEIRLLEIQPARNLDEPIESRLVTVRLSDSDDHDFIGLSSLYGDPGQTETILVNGRPVTITLHLAQALRNVRAVFYPTISRRFQRRPARRPHRAPRWLRHLFGMSSSSSSSSSSSGPHASIGNADPDRPHAQLRVWLDLVCVNQRDEAEKSRQLVEMRNIYRAAELVVGWLGEKSEHTDVAMATLAEIEDAMPPHWGDPGDRERHPEDYAPTHRWAASIAHIWAPGPDGEIPFTMPHWVGCNDFMGRQYFQRRWILEEIARARFPAFLIGDTVVPWKQVLRLNRMMEEFKYHRSHVFPAVCVFLKLSPLVSPLLNPLSPLAH